MEKSGYQHPLISVEDLKTYFSTLDGTVRAVDGVSFDIKPGETMGLVGESGSGKSVTAFTILRLLPRKISHIAGGRVYYDRQDGEPPLELTRLRSNGMTMRRIRGNEISMIFQEPLTSFSPVHTIGNQIMEVIQLHQNVDRGEAQERALDMLVQVGISNPAQRFNEYPHQFSGGMRQRAMIAMALSCNPALLIADEPTTALDVTIQAQMIDLMQSLQDRFGMAILIITHNLGVIAEMSERVSVMYMGRVVEMADVGTIFKRPLHPYTVGLMRSIPRLGKKARLTPIPGSVPDPLSVPQGCAFYPRCIAPKNDACKQDVPLIEVEAGHTVRCTLYQSMYQVPDSPAQPYQTQDEQHV
ncbi:MAG: ABC transporter ATP-binding protein [Chloroflexi bacterium]|nr:ABC transporter ATP-binding protein [Chloroflexota bacterium]